MLSCLPCNAVCYRVLPCVFFEESNPVRFVYGTITLSGSIFQYFLLIDHHFGFFYTTDCKAFPCWCMMNLHVNSLTSFFNSLFENISIFTCVYVYESVISLHFHIAYLIIHYNIFWIFCQEKKNSI